MSGSLKWMTYVTDGGQSFAVKIDESNGEANGFADYTNESGLEVLNGASKIMRYANAVSTTDERVRRKFYIGTPARFLAFANGGQIIADGTTYAVTTIRGEKRRIAFAQDTGQDDGDAT